MKRLLFVLAGIFFIPAFASAQAITSMTVNLSTGQSAVLPAAVYTCGVTPKTAAVAGVINPSKIIWDDPANPTNADCVYNDPVVGGLLHSLPFGPTSYTATATATNAGGVSGVSNVTLPFSRPGTAPSAPTGLRLVRNSYLPWRHHFLLG